MAEYTPEKAQNQLAQLVGEQMARGLSVEYAGHDQPGMRISVTRPENSSYPADFVIRKIQAFLEHAPDGENVQNPEENNANRASFVARKMKENLKDGNVRGECPDSFWQREFKRLGLDVDVRSSWLFSSQTLTVSPESNDRFCSLFPEMGAKRNEATDEGTYVYFMRDGQIEPLMLQAIAKQEHDTQLLDSMQPLIAKLTAVLPEQTVNNIEFVPSEEDKLTLRVKANAQNPQGARQSVYKFFKKTLGEGDMLTLSREEWEQALERAEREKAKSDTKKAQHAR